MNRDIMTRAFGLAAFAALGLGAAQGAWAADTWRHGVVEAKGDAGIIFMPTKFDDKHDLDIEMVQFTSSTTPVKALIAGEIDSFATTPLVAMTAMSQGADLRFVGCDWPGMTYTLYSSADVKTMEDLKGKSVGVSGPGSAPDLFAREALRSGGVDPQEVTFANAGGGGDRFRALAAGVVDATATSSEFEPEAERRGLTILARAPEATPNFVRMCMVTTAENIEKRRDELVRFLAANMEGYRHALDNPEETYTLAREIVGLPEDDKGPEFIFEEAVRYNAITPDLDVQTEKLQWNADMLARNDVIRNELNIEDFVDEGPREEALKRVQGS